MVAFGIGLFGHPVAFLGKLAILSWRFHEVPTGRSGPPFPIAWTLCLMEPKCERYDEAGVGLTAADMKRTPGSLRTRGPLRSYAFRSSAARLGVSGDGGKPFGPA
jgi:hypothetical protein